MHQPGHQLCWMWVVCGFRSNLTAVWRCVTALAAQKHACIHSITPLADGACGCQRWHAKGGDRVAVTIMQCAARPFEGPLHMRTSTCLFRYCDRASLTNCKEKGGRWHRVQTLRGTLRRNQKQLMQPRRDSLAPWVHLSLTPPGCGMPSGAARELHSQSGSTANPTCSPKLQWDPRICATCCFKSPLPTCLRQRVAVLIVPLHLRDRPATRAVHATRYRLVHIKVRACLSSADPQQHSAVTYAQVWPRRPHCCLAKHTFQPLLHCIHSTQVT